MIASETAWADGARARFLRPDAHRWIRPDLARLYPPGTDLEALFPGWKRVDPARRVPMRQTSRDAVTETQAAYEDINAACELARNLAEIKQLRAELRTIQAFLAYRRAYRRYAEFCKYRPDQPRVPAGNRDGGQWRRDGGGSAGGNDPRVLSDADPENTWEPGAQYAQNEPSESPGIGHNDGPSLEPPDIPQGRPRDSADRTMFQKEVARWLDRFPSLSLAGIAFSGLLNNIGWLKEYQASIESYRDPPRSLEELQSGTDDMRPGYEKHHIVEKTPASFDGFSKSEIEGSKNLVRVPKLKHYEITGWFSTKNRDYGGLSPREYLRGKGWEERREIGLEALRRFRVLEP